MKTVTTTTSKPTKYAPQNTAAYNIEFLRRYCNIASVSGIEYDILCPSHGDRNASMRVNVEKGVFYCHGCHLRGTLSSLARLLGAPYKRPNAVEASMSELMGKLDRLNGRGQQPAPREFWDESRLDRYRTVPTDFWTRQPPRGRGYTDATVEAFDLGYDPLEEHAIIPVRDTQGRLLGVTRRNLNREERWKYKDPKHFNKATNLFASWFVARHTSAQVVIVEAPLCAAKVWQAGHPAVAQYGSYITSEQIRLLRTLGVTCVVLAYDKDDGGWEAGQAAMGWHKKVKQGERKPTWFYKPETDLRRFFIVKRVSYPTMVRAKDPGEMSDQHLDQMIRKARYIN